MRFMGEKAAAKAPRLPPLHYVALTRSYNYKILYLVINYCGCGANANG